MRQENPPQNIQTWVFAQKKVLMFIYCKCWSLLIDRKKTWLLEWRCNTACGLIWIGLPPVDSVMWGSPLTEMKQPRPKCPTHNVTPVFCFCISFCIAILHTPHKSLNISALLQPLQKKIKPGLSHPYCLTVLIPHVLLNLFNICGQDW